MHKVFVTVGTYKEGFDKLVEVADQIAATEGQFEFATQAGFSKYKARHHRCIEFTETIDENYDWADIVVCTGGAGTIFSCLKKGKKIVSILDTDRIGIISEAHAYDITNHFRDKGMLVRCDRPEDLRGALKQAAAMPPYTYAEPPCLIAGEISTFLAK